MIPEAPAGPLIVLYDASCNLCRRLAEYGRRHARDRLDFVAWQDFAATPEAEDLFPASERAAPPAHLRTLQDGEVRQDRAAWEAILAAYPPFESLGWMAERLGLMGPVARVTYYGATWLRGRCSECP